MKLPKSWPPDDYKMNNNSSHMAWVTPPRKYLFTSGIRGANRRSYSILQYEVMCERMVITTRPVRFTPILSDNDLAYGSGQFLIHFFYYYCGVQEYFPDESIV
jgi:hypothetical protein